MSGTIGLSSLSLYGIYAANETKYAKASVAADPQSNALIAYFQKNASSIKTPDALLKNYKALTLVLGAFGLQGSINDTAILRKLMTQDPKLPNSLAHTLGNAKYQLFAQALSNWKAPPFGTSASRAQLVASYTTNTFEQTADKQAPGLANALYFTREASSLKTEAAVQSDANLLAVAVTSVGLPLQDFEQLNFDQQTATLKGKLNVSTLQDPSTVKRMAEQYLVAQQSSASNEPQAGSLAALYSDGVDTTGDSVLTILDPSSNTDNSGGSGVLSLFA